MSDTSMDKSLFFITISLVCVWIVVDMAVGEKYLVNFLETLFPFMKESGGSSGGGTTIDKSGFSGVSGSIDSTKVSASHGKWERNESGELVWVPSESASQAWNSKV